MEIVVFVVLFTVAVGGIVGCVRQWRKREKERAEYRKWLNNAAKTEERLRQTEEQLQAEKRYSASLISRINAKLYYN